MIEIDVSSQRMREVPDPHADANLSPSIPAQQPGHLSLVICGPLNQAERRARAYGVRLYNALETHGVVYARAPLRHEGRTRRWFADEAPCIEGAYAKKGSPLTPSELAPGTLVGWASRFYSAYGLTLNLVVRALISAGFVGGAWFVLGIYSLAGIDLVVLALWIYWHRADRLREGPTRDQWATLLGHIVTL
jgi:hypothetical protein